MGQEAIFEPSKSWLDLDCLLPRQLVSIDHAKPYIPIEITNCSDIEVVLDTRTPLGILSSPWKWTLNSPQTPLHLRQSRTGLLLK
jgi:hypothetical protein